MRSAIGNDNASQSGFTNPSRSEGRLSGQGSGSHFGRFSNTSLAIGIAENTLGQPP